MAEFSKYQPLLAQVEGKFQIHPDDAGNYNSKGELVGTNYGVSARFYERILGRVPTEADMRSITKPRATRLFEVYFWDKAMGDKIEYQPMANTIVDHYLNAGNGIKLAQQVLNEKFGFRLSEDNAMGANTLNALNSVKDKKKFVYEYNKEREAYYKSLGQSTWIKGWLKRLEDFAVDYKPPMSLAPIVLLIGAGYLAYIKIF